MSHIVGVGGWPWEQPEESARLRAFLFDLAGGRRVALVPTASAEDDWAIARLLEGWAEAQVSVVRFFPWPPDDVRERVLGSDLVLVLGGNTANMLAVWRVHGFDRLLRDAWDAGVVLAGWSAGMICWFEAGVTDSFGPQLDGMRDCLGFLPGSACPHYDGEERRRPRYHELVAGGFPAGYAADDGVALHFEGSGLREAVTARADAAAYRVGLEDGSVVEERLAVRLLR